jgi:hypothetical protein
MSEGQGEGCGTKAQRGWSKWPTDQVPGCGSGNAKIL